MRIVMIGAGYVGLVSGACFADFGHDVTCIDKDTDKIAALKQCKIPIFEPDLDKLVETGIDSGRLMFGTDLSCIAAADAVFIAVGTPSRRGDGHADLSYVHAAAREIGLLWEHLDASLFSNRVAARRIVARPRLQPTYAAMAMGAAGAQAAGQGITAAE